MRAVRYSSLAKYIDASTTGIGACFCWPGGCQVRLSPRVPDSFENSFPKGSSLIYAQEAGAVFLAAVVLRDRHPHHATRRVVILIDNNAALSAFVKASSSTGPAAAAVAHTWSILGDSQIAPWFEKVPTLLYRADEPSRQVDSFERAPIPTARPLGP